MRRPLSIKHAMHMDATVFPELKIICTERSNGIRIGNGKLLLSCHRDKGKYSAQETHYAAPRVVLNRTNLH